MNHYVVGLHAAARARYGQSRGRLRGLTLCSRHDHLLEDLTDTLRVVRQLRVLPLKLGNLLSDGSDLTHQLLELLIRPCRGAWTSCEHRPPHWRGGSLSCTKTVGHLTGRGCASRIAWSPSGRRTPESSSCGRHPCHPYSPLRRRSFLEPIYVPCATVYAGNTLRLGVTAYRWHRCSGQDGGGTPAYRHASAMWTRITPTRFTTGNAPLLTW